MIEVLELRAGRATPNGEGRAAQVLERGGLVVLPSLGFELEATELEFLDPAILDRSKNVSFDPATGVLGGTTLNDAKRERLSIMVQRFSRRAKALLDEITPTYVEALQTRRTSFRPGPVATRALSPRKDDRRLHIDAFPSNPVQGRRILRVFANVDPHGLERLWHVGEDDFETFARRFTPRLRSVRRPYGHTVLQRLGLTRGERTAYDQAMLDLHDQAKLDEAFQASASRRSLAFPAGSMWIVFTDSVLHAALAGQHALEQTFLLPAPAMKQPMLAPVSILERLMGRALL